MKKFLMCIILISIFFVIPGCKNTNTKNDNIIPLENSSQNEQNNKTNNSEILSNFNENSSNCDTSNEKTTSVLHWNLGIEPKCLDPALSDSFGARHIIKNIFEGLIREIDGKPYPGIAKSWEFSLSKKTITFFLRKSKWSDGSELTAHDFVFSFKRALNHSLNSEYSWIWEYTNIVGVRQALEQGNLGKIGIRALDDYTLEIELNEPNDYLILLLSFHHFVPVKEETIPENTKENYFKNPAKSISNGPFTVIEYNKDKELILEKNPFYWDSKNVSLEKIHVHFITDYDLAYNLYLKNNLHILNNLPSNTIANLNTNNQNLHSFSLFGTYYYSFNLDKKIWQDERIRRALSLAIDRTKLCDEIGLGQIPALSFIPPAFKNFYSQEMWDKRQKFLLPSDLSKLEEAKELLIEAGFENIENFPEITIQYKTSQLNKKIATLIKEMWKENLDLNVRLSTVEWSSFRDVIRKREFDIAMGGWLDDFIDPSGNLVIFKSQNPYNDSNYSNPVFDNLIANSKKSSGIEKIQYILEAEKTLLTNMPAVPIYHYSDTILTCSNLKDWKRSVLGTLDLKSAYFLD